VIRRFSLATALIVAVGLAGSATAQASTTSGTADSGAGAAASQQKPLCSPLTGKTMTWQGGAINFNADVFVIYWGSFWETPRLAVTDEIDRVLAGIGTSSWAKTLIQYCWPYQPPGYPIQTYDPPFWNPDPLVGSIVDNKNPPSAHPTDAQMRAEIEKMAQILFPANPGGVIGEFMLVTPPGVVPEADAGNVCGGHGSVDIPSAPLLFLGQDYYPWIDLPWGKISSQPIRCGPGNAGQRLSVAIAHEWAETVTDPYVDAPAGGPGQGWAWVPPKGQGQELADLCETRPAFRASLSTGTFMLPRLWSNLAPSNHGGKCVKTS